jgi:hypothetical protein
MSTCKSNMQGEMKLNFNTDGRTDGPNEDQLTTTSHVTAVDARAHIGDSTIVTVGEVIATGFTLTTERWPVVRTGERDPIPAHVRAAIFYRDRFQCQICPSGTELTGPWHLDHIVPWSAGGPDDSTNLRVLCEFHNLERSNFIDGGITLKRAVTWWCHRCYSDQAWLYAGWVVECPSHHYASQLRCRVARGYRRTWETTGEVPTWHERGPVESFGLTAYCAHCNMPGQTDVAL